MASQEPNGKDPLAGELLALQTRAVEDFYHAERERADAEKAAQEEAATLVGREDAQAVDARARVVALNDEAETAFRESDVELTAMGVGLERASWPSLPDDKAVADGLQEAVARACAARGAVAQLAKDYKQEQLRLKLEEEARRERLRLEVEALRKRIQDTAGLMSVVAFFVAIGGLYFWSHWPERLAWMADRVWMIWVFDATCMALVVSLGLWASGTEWNGMMTGGLVLGAAGLAWCLWRDDPGRAFGLMAAITGLAWPISIGVYRFLTSRRPTAYARLAAIAFAGTFAVCAIASAWVGLAQRPAVAAGSRDWNNVREAKSVDYYWLAEGKPTGETVYVTFAGVDTPVDARLYAKGPHDMLGKGTLVRGITLEPNTELRLAFEYGGSIRILPDKAVRYEPSTEWQSLLLEAGPGTYRIAADGLSLPPITASHTILITITPAPDEGN